MLRFLTLVILIPSMVYALSFSEIKSDLREKLSPYLSEKRLTKVFGDKKPVQSKEKLELPDIPKLTNSATDQSVYKTKEIEKKVTQFDKLTDIQKQKYRIAFLKELYQVVSRRNISQNLLMTYVDRLSQGAKREGIYRSIVASKDYFELESSPTVASDKLISFTNNFSTKFLNTKFNDSTLRNSNKYLIKRNLTEKALDVVEFLGNNPEDLYSWYAIFSVEISKFNIWTNKVRKSDSEASHYRWAKKTSFDLIKSEVIIKIHKICNMI